MQQTERLGLNQWELSDHIRMEDFNADNQKLDGALQTIDGLFQCHPSGELIGSTTLTAEAETIELDISAVDWSRYMLVILDVEVATGHDMRISFGSGGEWAVYIYRNNEPPHTVFGVAGFYSATHVTTVVPVFYSEKHIPTALSFGFSNLDPYQTTGSISYGLLSGGGGTRPLSQCKKISIHRNDALFRPRDKIALWGLK